jgi:hypothetical protein
MTYIVSTSSAATDWASVKIAALTTASGITAPKVLYEHFLGGLTYRWLVTANVTGTISLVNPTISGSCIKFASGTSVSACDLNLLANQVTYLSGAAAKFAVACRFRVATAINLNCNISIGSLNSALTAGFQAGVLGGVSTTKYALRTITTGGTIVSVASTVNIDTGWHDMVVINDGSNPQKFSIDGETYVPLASAGVPDVAHGPAIICRDFVGGTNRTLEIANLLYLFENP